jgi:hypothetical protein
MSPASPAPEHEELMQELRRCAGWEDLPGAIAAAKRLAALPGPDVPAVLVTELVSLDAVDLSEDAGDVADELYRKRAALQAGLALCGSRAVALLRPLLAGQAGCAAQVALRVLAELGDPAAIPVARRWLADNSSEAHGARLAAIEAIGKLRPPDAARLLREVLTRPGVSNRGWMQRIEGDARQPRSSVVPGAELCNTRPRQLLRQPVSAGGIGRREDREWR